MHARIVYAARLQYNATTAREGARQLSLAPSEPREE